MHCQDRSMTHDGSSSLTDKGASIGFYEDRYTHGYMEGHWPVEKQQRIADVIGGLRLPATGHALDFGCGDGVLTDVVRRALPAGWTVSGCDISETAVERASKRFPSCAFFVATDREYLGQKVDLLFTHHVLEHVYSLSEVLQDVQKYLNSASAMLHILPCGNVGSFEHSVCLLREDGINPRVENRFFFEEEGHVRRLTTQELSDQCSELGFSLVESYYSSQFFGALDWITASGPAFIDTFTDTSQPRNAEARRELRKLRYRLWAIWALRYPAVFVESRLRKRGRTLRDYFFLGCGLPLYAFAKPMDLFLRRKSREEWQARKSDSRGSEMYLLFKREKRA